MEVRIGVVYTPRELTVETDESVDGITGAIDNALSAGDAMLWLTDTKGRRIGVTADKIAYIEIDEDGDNRRVGFGR